MKTWRVGVVGAGLIGARRAHVAFECQNSKVIRVADSDFEKAKAIANEVGAIPTAEWETIVNDPQINVLVIATPTDLHHAIAIAALRKGKHVLCEKPLARTSSEARRMIHAAYGSGAKLKTGFNHRFHAAIFKAHKVVAKGGIGKPIFARCVYGHGGRKGYEKEWRVNPKTSGGGELVDQGIHVLDLFRWFLGDIREVSGMVGTLFWPIKPVDDNSFALFRTKNGAIAQLHVSWTQWKNRFSFEVFGDKGYTRVEGLGKSYGPERLTVGRRHQPGVAPEETTEEFSGIDTSWAAEWSEFLGALDRGKDPIGDGRDGFEAARLVDAIYRSSKTKQVVKL